MLSVVEASKKAEWWSCDVLQTDLQTVKTRYREMYGERLEDTINDECSGDYRKLLLKILAPDTAWGGPGTGHDMR